MCPEIDFNSSGPEDLNAKNGSRSRIGQQQQKSGSYRGILKTAYQRFGDPVSVHHDDLVVAGLVAHSSLVHVPEHLQM